MYDYMKFDERKEALVTLDKWRATDRTGQAVNVFANAHTDPVEAIGTCMEQHHDGLSVSVDFRQTLPGYKGRGPAVQWWHRRTGKFQELDLRTYFYAWENIIIPGIRP